MKTYFNRPTIWLCAALIIYVLFTLYDSELHLLFTRGIETPKTMQVVLWFTEVLSYILITGALIQFLIFMRSCNRDRLFTSLSSKQLKRISVILLTYGVIELISSRFFGSDSSLSFAIGIFIGSLSLSFSKIIEKATQNKQDNDLTI